jgi:hypothetical protein
MCDLSRGERSVFQPIPLPSRVSSAGTGYCMIEVRSYVVPATWLRSNTSKTFDWIVARSQPWVR